MENDKYESLSRRLRNIEQTLQGDFATRLRELEMNLKEHIAICTEKEKRMAERDEALKEFYHDCRSTHEKLQDSMNKCERYRSRWQGGWFTASLIAFVIAQLVIIATTVAALFK